MIVDDKPDSYVYENCMYGALIEAILKVAMPIP